MMARTTRLRTAAVLAGSACYVLALPPFDLAVLAWVALVPLLLVVAELSPVAAFAWGLLYGFAAAWAATWWFALAVAHYFAAGIVLAVLGMSAAYLVAIASAFGLFAAATAFLAGVARRRTIRALLIASIWTASELVRARLFAQPWDLLGYTQHAHVGLIQIAALTGVYGVSFLLVLANAAIAEAVRAVRRGDRVRHAIAACGVPAALIMFVWLLGTARAVRGPAGGFAAHPVAVVQTGIAPAYRWTRGYAEQQLLAHMRATDALPATLHPGLVVWPENALTLYLENEPALAAELGALAARRHTDLLFGAPRFESGHTYNSARMMTAAGRLGGHYDKQHLVLFAEAPPFGAGAAAPDESPRSFTAGTGPGVLQSFVSVGVSICHEIIYPDVINRSVRAGAALLVNISNDGWLDAGYGLASRQHFAMATFRAVETRRYLVRAATTGISGMVDPFGRVLTTLPPNTVGAATATVAGRTGLTPYVRLGDTFAFTCTLIVLVLAGARLRSARLVLTWRRRPTRAHAPAHLAS
jgi:apolipoprotein N-acyltransferase